MPRRPLGTYVRTTADWFLNETYSVGSLVGVGSTEFMAYSLFNADQHGRVVVVDAIDIYLSAAGVLQMWLPYGVDGTQVAAAAPIVAGNPAGTTKLFQYLGGNTRPPLLNTVPISASWSITGSLTAPLQVRERGPLAYLKPGYSCAIGTLDQVNAELNVNYYFSILKE